MRFRFAVTILLFLFFSPLASASDGEQLYIDNCSICHGHEGTGGVGIPLALKSFLNQASDDYLRKTIRLGRPGRIMPSFYRLSDTEIEQIIHYIRSWRPQQAPTWEQSAINGDPAKGRELFTNNCATCHGSSASGGKGTGVMFSRPRQLPITAPALNNQGFLNSAPDTMIKNIIINGRHDTPMPSASDLKLSDQDVNDIVSYIRSFQQPIVPRSKPVDDEPVIIYESPYSLDETIANLKREIIGKNFRLIRDQALDSGLVAPEHESKNKTIVYFCNFNFLYEALAIDPRVGIFLPCRITVVEKDGKVKLMSINPKHLGRLFNNSELDKACDEMFNVYTSIMEDATL